MATRKILKNAVKVSVQATRINYIYIVAELIPNNNVMPKAELLDR
jgi:hypothetical protein